MYRWNGNRGALEAGILVTSTFSTACGTAATNTIPDYTAVDTLVLKKGDRLLIVPYVIKSGGGGSTATTITMLVDAPSAAGFSRVIFPGTVPFATSDDQTAGPRPARLQ